MEDQKVLDEFHKSAVKAFKDLKPDNEILRTVLLENATFQAILKEADADDSEIERLKGMLKTAKEELEKKKKRLKPYLDGFEEFVQADLKRWHGNMGSPV